MAESGNPLFVHRVATRGGIWGFFFYASWMCHLIATATPDHAALLSLGRVVRSGLGWVAGLVLGSLVRRAMPILAPYFCQHPVSYDMVAAVRRGGPPADPRTWESHPITRLLRRHVRSIRRRCRKRSASFCISVHTPHSLSHSHRPLWAAPPPRRLSARRGRGVSCFPLLCLHFCRRPP